MRWGRLQPAAVKCLCQLLSWHRPQAGSRYRLDGCANRGQLVTGKLAQETFRHFASLGPTGAEEQNFGLLLHVMPPVLQRLGGFDGAGWEGKILAPCCE